MADEKRYALELTKDEFSILLSFSALGLAFAVGARSNPNIERLAALLSHGDAMYTLAAKITAVNV
jgi:hypothetical protein